VSGHLHSVEHAAALDTPVHRLDPRVKILVLIGTVLVVVATPEAAWWAFGAYGLLLAGLAAAARLPLAYVARRLLIEVPFLVAALLLVALQGWVPGLTLAARITLSALAMVLLSSTTPFPLLLRGFERLRAPGLIVTIVALMWRYLHVLGDEVRRMRVAREARAYRPRTLWQARRATGATIGALFLRSLERGERVHLAMQSRGYTGGIPTASTTSPALRAADIAFTVAAATAIATARLALT
jgi:cobalt/nickel transport system permease protein